MCGIAALISAKPHDSLKLIQAMTAVVRHRGPDDEGVVLFAGPDATPMVRGGSDTPAACYDTGLPYSPPRVSDNASEKGLLALGHRRLSIVDISPSGHQPMCSENGRYWITYNGEIYNHIELRHELEALGYNFSSRCDTEVVLAAYHRWEKECLHRFNGMFAFILFDREQKKVFAARDRFGVKPLYYWVSPEGLIAFASEIKQFTVLPGWRAKVNGQRAYDFMNWGLIDHTDESLFDGVFQLRGGEALELGATAVSAHAPGAHLPVYRWYELKPLAFSGSLNDAAREFKRLLADSINLRLRADVPVGSCLSGGLDSSSIVCLMNDLLRDQNAHALQNTFSACSDVKRFDEREFIDEVARHTAIEAHYVYPRLSELFGTLDEITWHQDEPFGSTSIYAQWHVFKLAAQHQVKVMLDGQGADEQLAGYHNYFSARFGGLLRNLRWATLYREIRTTQTLHGYPRLWGIKQMLNNILAESLRQPLRQLAGKPGTQPRWLDMDALGAAGRDPFLERGAAKAESIRAMSHSQLTSTSLQMLLHWEDRDSMAHSIEARVPFLDYRLVEFVLGLPDEYKIAKGMTKRVLREAMHGTLPERVRNRVDKLGFATAEETWLREENPDLFRKALREAVELSHGIVKSEALELLDQMIAGNEPFSFLGWRLISFGNWIRVFGVQF